MSSRFCAAAAVVLDSRPMLGMPPGYEWAVAVSVLAYLALMAVGRTVAHRRGQAISVPFHLFSLLLAFRVGAPVYLAAVPRYDQAAWWKMLEAAMILSGALVVVDVFSFVVYELYFPTVRKLKLPRLLRDITTVVVTVIAVSIILKVEFNLSLAAILTTSTILAATVGLAMQELLNNLIAGVTLQFEKPFKVGDWVKVDGIEGEVAGINWRATRVVTIDGETVVVPNGSIAKGMLINYYEPTQKSALNSTVGVDYGVPPNKVKECLLQAASQCEGVLADPAPTARLIQYGDSSITYELKYWVDDRSRAHELRDAVMTRFWYRLRRERIGIPFPIRTIRMERGQTVEEVSKRQCEDALQVISKVSLLESLAPDQMKWLAERAKLVSYGAGEVVVRQGDSDQTLFIIEEGVAEVEVAKEGAGPTMALALNPGDYFGEISLLTGEARSATVRARGDMLLLRIDKDDIGPILAANPALVEAMSKVLAIRRMRTEGFFREYEVAPGADEAEMRYRERFVNAIRRFFKLGGGS